jgi:hypothetical protein
MFRSERKADPRRFGVGARQVGLSSSEEILDNARRLAELVGARQLKGPADGSTENISHVLILALSSEYDRQAPI